MRQTSLDDVVRRLCETCRAMPTGLFVDFDGTVSPIVPSPQQATIDPRCRVELAQLTDALPLVAIVSGRAIDDLALRVDVPGAVLVGNHGLEVEYDGGVVLPPGVDQHPRLLRELFERLRPRLPTGAILEHKGPTGSIHYRQTAEPDRARREILDALADENAGSTFRIREGRMVVELRPPVDVDKGTAVRDLIVERGLRSAVYVGDDQTDADAFRRLHAMQGARELDRAIAVGVLGPETPTAVSDAADLLVTGIDGVATMLADLRRCLSTG